MIMRELHNHDAIPHHAGLRIFVADEPGAGGANHRYEITGVDHPNPSHKQEDVHQPNMPILFQNGTISDNGRNGITVEVLLAIGIDRLRAFQAGPFACRENALALMNLEQSLQWLHHRTRNRVARQVEGKHES